MSSETYSPIISPSETFEPSLPQRSSNVTVDAVPRKITSLGVNSLNSEENEENSSQASNEVPPVNQVVSHPQQPGVGSGLGGSSGSSTAPPSDQSSSSRSPSGNEQQQQHPTVQTNTVQNIQVVNIGSGSFVNASNVNILSNVYNINHSAVSRGMASSPAAPPPLSPQAQALLKDCSAATPEIIQGVRLDRHWRHVMRRLGLSDADIDTTSETHLAVGNVQEAVYQCLRLWRESRGSAATVAALCNALLRENQTQPLEQLAQDHLSS